MANSADKDEQCDSELADVADAYFRARKNGTAETIDALVEKHPHLGQELRESLEAIELLSIVPATHPPESLVPPILGDFLIHHELGRGGMGVVYFATQISLNRQVALKVFSSWKAEAIPAERFEREAQTVAALRHDHIVPIYAAGKVEACQPEQPHAYRYFAMQLIEGESVAQLIAMRDNQSRSRTQQRERARKIAQWCSHIAAALECAHQQGVVHGDIKPSNLILDREQRIWLTDFGLARHNLDSPANLAVSYQGTPKYMSPEQASAIAAPVDHRTDIYSLGVTLIEWLTGESLVGGNNPVESLSRLQQNSIEEPQLLLRGYSRDWIAVVNKCTAREPKDRYPSASELAADLRALADHRPVSARPQRNMVRLVRSALHQTNMVRTAIVSAVATLAMLGLGSAAWRAYWESRRYPVIFESSSGDWLAVTAWDASNELIAKFNVPSEEVLLPGREVHLDVTASHRLSYKRKIDPAPSSNSIDRIKAIQLEDPVSHRWILDDIVWYQNLDCIRDGELASYCIALRTDSVVLLETSSGDIVWSVPCGQTHWGNSVRGCPSTFQPDRCVVVNDTNGNASQEIIFAHPTKPELMCLDSSSGELLWRTDLLESSGIQTPDAGSLCPIIMHYDQAADNENTVDGATDLCVVVAPHVPEPATKHRWLMSVDLATGQVGWNVASQQTLTNTAVPVPIASRPLHLQWGQIEKRPLDFGRLTRFYYFDDYWRVLPNAGLSNPYDLTVRLGTDRPFSLRDENNAIWHWIDGQDWHVIDRVTGELRKAWQLPDDCVCSPKLLRTSAGRTLVLTVHKSMVSGTDFIAWDGASNQVVWKQNFDSDLDRLPQSYLSPASDFPIIVDLDGDNCDEWIAPTYIPGTKWSSPMTPPYGMLMAHRGDNGNAIWDEPFYLPNMDGMVERGVAVVDQDGDGWKDLLFGSRFHGGGVRAGVACFVDLISGRTGQRIWQSNVRVEQNELTIGPNELVDLAVVEDQSLITVVTHAGLKTGDLESARPYSTTFLDLANGTEKTFGWGIRANAFSRDMWLEHRFPPSGDLMRENRPRPAKLVGWSYPASKSDSLESLTLWSTEDYGPMLCADLDRDGYPEVIGFRNYMGYYEYCRLDGLTGSKEWSRRIREKVLIWFELGQDANGDGIDDLVTITTYDSTPTPLTAVEIVCGSTGRTLWKHSAKEPGGAKPIGVFKRDSGKLPLFLYQNESIGKVTCVDLNSRTVIWESDTLGRTLEDQAFATWVSEGKIVWFSINSADDGSFASFVNAETGDSLLQIPVGPKLAAPWSDWIQWNGRELLRIQTFSEYQPDPASSEVQYQMDLWLVDRSAAIAGHWSETATASSLVAKNWFQRSRHDLPYPTVVTESTGKELLAVPTCFDGIVVVRLLDWEDDATSKLRMDRTVRLPIDPGSAFADVRILDCDGDGLSDYLSISDAGIDCLTLTGEVLWQRPPPPVGSNLLYAAQEIRGRSFLGIQTDPGYLAGIIYMDVRTGEVDTEIQSDPRFNALNVGNEKHASLITHVYTTKTAKLSAICRSGTNARGPLKLDPDPRYVGLLPWVVNAKSFVNSNPVAVHRFPWTRILKLSIGVFLLPVAVGWSCFRKRFSLRHLWLVATTIAIALSLALADKSTYPTDALGHGYLSALQTAAEIAVFIFLFALPIMELAQDRWRRRLSLSVYCLFILIIPVFTLMSYSRGPIQTTYTLQEFWHLFWFALLPTGAVLFLVHSLQILGSTMARMVKGWWRRFSSTRSSNIPNYQGAGDSHGG